jgi:hypothetical protein
MFDFLVQVIIIYRSNFTSLKKYRKTGPFLNGGGGVDQLE